MVNESKPYRLTPKKKAAIIAYFNGDIPQYALAKHMRLKHRQYLERAMFALFRHAVRTGKIDIEKLLKEY